MLTVERELQEDSATSPEDSGNIDRPSTSTRRHVSHTEMPMISDALSQCAAAFGTERARFVRQSVDGAWTVYTLHQGSVTSHVADHAEIAMAWTVGLSRFPIRVTRPRVTLLDGSGTRPISVTGYVGIPILCQNHFAGVIELSGSTTGDIERVLESLNETLARLGYRLIHDPAIRAPQHIDLDVECGLTGGFWSPNEMTLEVDEWSVLSVLGSPVVLREIASTLPMSDERLVDVLHSLVARGLVSVRASTGALFGPDDPQHTRAAVALDDSGE